MNIKQIKTELDRGLDFIFPWPIGFAHKRPNFQTKIEKQKDVIIYTIKLK